MRYIVLFIILHFFPLFCDAQTFGNMPKPSEKSIILVSYNCENLFDTINNPLSDDDDFTPSGKYKWTSKRYFNKINNLAKVITSLHSENFPSLLCLVEVENKNVVIDLLSKTELKKYNYKVIHHESPDKRGIDVAFAYREDIFKLIHEKPLHVVYENSEKKEGRNIQYVCVSRKNCDTLHIFINHWKSRSGGKEITESMRKIEAQVLRNAVDSIFSLNRNAGIIICGDFNDEPDDKSLKEILRATDDEKHFARLELYNLMSAYKKQGLGTYEYEKKWNMLDHIITNKGFFSKTNRCLFTTPKSAGIISPDWIFYTDNSSKRWPNATYGGTKYFGGYSDHLPIYLIIEETQKK